MVRNSPLVKKKGYQVLDTQQKDPFVKGISFNVQYYASAEVPDTHNSPAVQNVVWEICDNAKRNSKSLRKVVLTVRAHNMSVVDEATKITDTYPIFLVAYCGGHGDLADCFYFIHKTKLDKTMRVEAFRASSAGKVKAITLAVAKAFNISYKAWIMKKKKAEKAERSAEKLNGAGAGSDSPVLQTKALPPQGKSNLAKMAPGVVTGGTYTPPALRKPPSGIPESSSRTRSGSFGDQPETKNPVVMRAMVHNEHTGSTHNVVLTDEFDLEFQQLAESRVQPDVLRTSFSMEETDAFSFDAIKVHIDDDPN